MSLFISDAHAQAAAAPPGGAMGQLLILGVFVVVFYFLLIRPQQKRQKDGRADQRRDQTRGQLQRVKQPPRHQIGQLQAGEVGFLVGEHNVKRQCHRPA